MDRSQKQQIAAALHQDLADTVCVVVTHQTGLSVEEVNQLRRQMRNAGARFALDPLKKAVEAEDQLNYDEPPPWPLPTRLTRGQA